MTKVRLYHLAHEWHLSSVDMLEALHEAGHRQMKSHFSEVPYEDVQSLKLLLTDAGLFGVLEEDVPEEAVAEDAETATEAVAEVDGATEVTDADTSAEAVAEDTPPEATDAVADAPAADAVADAPAADAVADAPAADAVADAPAADAPATDDAPAATADAPADATADSDAAAPEAKPVETEPAVEAPKTPEPTPAEPVKTPEVAKTPAEPAKAKPAVAKIPTANPAVVPPPPPGTPTGVAAGFRGFAAGFDPNARRSRDRARAGAGRTGSGAPGGRPDPAAVPGADANDKNAGRRRPVGARTAISPTKRGKQATRRSGGQARQGRGRRKERRMQERDRWHKASRKRRHRGSTRGIVRPTEATVRQPISLKDLSAALAIRVSEIMGALMKEGMMISLTQPVPADAIEFVGVNWNIDIKVVDEVTAEGTLLDSHKQAEEDPDAVPRQPVVAVLGHVDHGKTSLLDFIRKAKKPVTKQEAGGITQHIGAYVANHAGQNITFIDTPGHEAFTEMRVRGANVTDMVLLVIAADDGVMPQTKEAIQHALAAGAHIIVACNKIDKKGTDKQKVMQGLSQIEGVLPEDYGGDTEVIGCSAITGEGIDDLLEAITRYAELLELKANPKKPAKATVLEARRTTGRGIVVTALIQEGTLKKGNLVVAGNVGGKVRTLFDDNGKNMKSAGPATPVEILGFEDVPDAGDMLYVVKKDSDLKRVLAERREARLRGVGETAFDHIPTDEQGIWTKLAGDEVKTVNLVLKADVSGSLQVLKRELRELSTDEVKCKIVRDGVGGLSTADILLATASNSVCLGFGVIADAKARRLAREKQVEIHTFRVIYELLDGVKAIMAGALDPEERENVLGTVEIRKVFKSSKLGLIAGCFVESGICRRNAMVRLSRDGIILWQGELGSLRRFKDDVKEVRENFECGIVLRGYDNVKAGDSLEVFEIQKIARTLD